MSINLLRSLRGIARARNKADTLDGLLLVVLLVVVFVVVFIVVFVVLVLRTIFVEWFTLLERVVSRSPIVRVGSVFALQGVVICVTHFIVVDLSVADATWYQMAGTIGIAEVRRPVEARIAGKVSGLAVCRKARWRSSYASGQDVVSSKSGNAATSATG